LIQKRGEKMFGHLIYFNNDKVTEYNAILHENEIIEYESVDITKEKSGDANLKVLSGGKKSVESYHGKVIKNDMLICNGFMTSLSSSDSYKDFIDGDIEYDSEYLTRGNIIRFESNIVIPEKFDLFKIWDTFKEYFNQELAASIAPDDYKTFGKLFETKELKIPICININKNLGCALLVSSLLKCDYEILENLESDEVVILAKVISNKKKKEKEIFNPLTDFLSFNRYIRRSAEIEKDLPIELSKIYVNENYISLEILAIYQ
jgi:hypothetical protein